MENKVIIVTGGAKGIGEAITRMLSAEGAIPVILGRKERENIKLVEELRAQKFLADHVVVQLSHPDECRNAVALVLQRHGRINGVVNNAGLNDGVGLENGNYNQFVESLHKNLIHYYLTVHYALPELKKSKGPIVNISSKTAETGQGNTSGYAASNGGRNALTREWAVELLKYEIRVNAIAVAECWTPQYADWIETLPGAEKKLREITSHIPFGQRMTTPDEIANMACFLLSEKSSHTTGQIIHVDGGYVHLDRALANK